MSESNADDLGSLEVDTESMSDEQIAATAVALDLAYRCFGGEGLKINAFTNSRGERFECEFSLKERTCPKATTEHCQNTCEIREVMDKLARLA